MNTTLGYLIDALERKDPEKPVYYDFCSLVPTTIDSYRGYYDHLAIGWREDTIQEKTPTVASVLAMLKEAVGKTYHGYKGGNYSMDRETPVWAANWGRTGSTVIKDVRDAGWCIILETENQD